MRSLIVATSNPGKLREVAEFLSDIPEVRIGSLRDIPSVPQVAEDGITFRQNAIKKAEEYSRAFPGLVLADDSGLCVDALGGDPGVRSARFGGPGLDDAGRCRYLLERLKDVPDEARGARFECAVALAEKGRLLATFSGTVDGGLLRRMRGENGFGYDPIFFHPPSRRTFAELTTEEKSAVSHRGRALAALRAYLLEHPDLLA
jgi:XTP/dITP diphosphohydrolase